MLASQLAPPAAAAAAPAPMQMADVPSQLQMSTLAAQLHEQQQQLQKHQEALRAQQKYLEDQQQYIQQLCNLQVQIRNETPESASRLLTQRDAPMGRSNQWNYSTAPMVPPISLTAPKSRLLPKEHVERLTNWYARFWLGFSMVGTHFLRL
jgi:hypothetical protein